MDIRPHLLAILPACLACPVVHPVSPPLALPAQGVAAATSDQLREAYLECDRISAGSRVDPDFMTLCQKVGDVLLERDFGGDFSRQLQWWRSARDAHRAARERAVRAAGSR